MRIAYKAKRLIDGNRSEPLLDAAVVVEDDSIVEVVGSAQLAPDLRVHDLGDATIVPGMIDCHRHLCLAGTADWDQLFSRETPAKAAFRAARNAVDTLRHGITTVRDAGSRHGIGVALRDAIDEGIVVGPRVLAGSTPIAMSGGHGLYLSRVADGPAEIKKAAREELKAGADLLKIMASGGVLPASIKPGAPQLSRDEIQAAVEEAHNQGRPVAAHAISERSIENALKAGADSIEHGQYLSPELASWMVEEQRYLVPTLSVFYRVHREGLRLGLPDYVTGPALETADAGMRAMRVALEAGVTIGLGTDTGAFLMRHDRGLTDDLELFVKAGCSPMQALQAATSAAARVIGMADRIGTLEAGKWADVVAVGGDPLVDLKALEDVRLVVKGGEVIVSQPTTEAR